MFWTKRRQAAAFQTIYNFLSDGVIPDVVEESLTHQKHSYGSTGSKIRKGRLMKNRSSCLLTGIFWVSALLSQSLWAADVTKITVLNPRGIQPPIRLIPMAPRLDTLEGKTIYVVDTKYPLTRPFVQEVFNVLKERYPKTNWIFRDKIGSYFDDDPKLWAEIKEKGHGMVMAVGH